MKCCTCAAPLGLFGVNADGTVGVAYRKIDGTEYCVRCFDEAWGYKMGAVKADAEKARERRERLAALSEEKKAERRAETEALKSENAAHRADVGRVQTMTQSKNEAGETLTALVARLHAEGRTADEIAEAAKAHPKYAGDPKKAASYAKAYVKSYLTPGGCRYKAPAEKGGRNDEKRGDVAYQVQGDAPRG
jgi:hypothetical protein